MRQRDKGLVKSHGSLAFTARRSGDKLCYIRGSRPVVGYAERSTTVIHWSMVALDEDRTVRNEGQPHPVDGEAHVVFSAGLVPGFRPLGPSADNGVGTLPIRQSSAI